MAIEGRVTWTVALTLKASGEGMDGGECGRLSDGGVMVKVPPVPPLSLRILSVSGGTNPFSLSALSATHAMLPKGERESPTVHMEWMGCRASRYECNVSSLVVVLYKVGGMRK